jgi:hypothetical protein
MAINFPTGQTLNQIYTYGGYSWQWNGNYWQVYPQGLEDDTFVTGFTLSNNLVNLTQNRTDNYSSFTISLSAYTGSTGVSGNYLPLSGGTLTGGVIFQNGLTANTISATTYFNLPVSGLTSGAGIGISNLNGNYTISYTGSSSGGTISGDYLPLSGGTVTGGTQFTGGLTANTISATTYLNYPDSYVTGFSLNNNTITLSQNRIDSYSSFTISLSAYTGSTGVSGDYLPLSGGTVTGATNFTAGLTANTISATTYQNLPIDIRTTGVTYSNNTFIFTNNTGGTYSVLFNTVTGLTVNGGLTANTISATTYYNLPQYDAGLLTNSDQWINNNDGTVTLPTAYVALYSQTGYPNTVQVYIVTGGTSGTEFPALSNNDTNYVVIKYNGGSPIWDILTDNSTINGETIVLTHIIYRANNFIHVLDFGNDGFALPNKLNDRVIAIDRFGRESGFSLGLSGSTGVVTLTAGIAWNGTNRQSLVAVNSQDDIFFQNYHSGGNWVYTTSSNTLNNLYYDNGTNPVLAAGGKYLVNWYFRGQEINDHLYEVWGNDEYDNVSEAQLSTEPNLPELITSHAFLTGRIIVQVSATTGLVESAFVQVFQPSTVQAHNDLTGIQGGQSGEYYHLTSTQYSNVVYKNITNIFTSDQIFNNSITSTTISATTYQNLPVSGLTGGDNISVTGSNGNFTISFTGTTGSNFTGGTVSGATIFTDGLTANTISATTYQNLPVSAITNGNGISVSSNNNGLVTITNTQQQGITGITATDGLSGDTTSFLTTIINIDKGSSQNIFKNIQIGGITQFSANSNNSDLNFSGIGITITSAATNTLVFTNSITQGITGITAGYGISADTSNNVTTIIQVFDYGKAYTTGNNLNFL